MHESAYRVKHSPLALRPNIFFEDIGHACKNIIGPVASRGMVELKKRALTDKKREKDSDREREKETESKSATTRWLWWIEEPVNPFNPFSMEAPSLFFFFHSPARSVLYLFYFSTGNSVSDRLLSHVLTTKPLNQKPFSTCHSLYTLASRLYFLIINFVYLVTIKNKWLYLKILSTYNKSHNLLSPLTSLKLISWSFEIKNKSNVTSPDTLSQKKI